MIYYWFHILIIFIRSRFFSTRVNVASTLTSTHRVSILDCEGLKYMSNSRYCYYMDFIRYQMFFRSNLFDYLRANKMFPILGSQKLIYRKPLKRWTKFSVTLILDGWESHWAYHKHIFRQYGEIVAIGYTKQAFWKKRKAQNVTEMLKNCGYEGLKRKPSKYVLDLFESDYRLLHEEQ